MSTRHRRRGLTSLERAEEVGKQRTTAGSLAEQSLAIAAEAEALDCTAMARMTLGMVHLRNGDLAAARALFEQAMDAYPADLLGTARVWILTSLAWVATEQGDLAKAQTWLVEALRCANEVLGAPGRVALPLEGLAQLATAAGQPLQALRLAGAAAALRVAYSSPPTPTQQTQLHGWLDRARAAVGGPAEGPGANRQAVGA